MIKFEESYFKKKNYQNLLNFLSNMYKIDISFFKRKEVYTLFFKIMIKILGFRFSQENRFLLLLSDLYKKFYL